MMSSGVSFFCLCKAAQERLEIQMAPPNIDSDQWSEHLSHGFAPDDGHEFFILLFKSSYLKWEEAKK